MAQNSPEFELESLQVRILNGRFGSQPQPKVVSPEALIALDQELSLADIKLHMICQFLKSHGLKTPSALETIGSLKKNTEDIYMFLLISNWNIK